MVIVCVVMMFITRDMWEPPPPSLEPFWWQPLRNATTRLNCSAGVGVQRVGSYGRTNNILIAWVHLLAWSVMQHPPATVVLSSEFIGTIGKHFDVDGATRSWACVASTWTGPMVRVPARVAYYASENRVYGTRFKAVVLHQLLMRPRPHVRDAVEAFERRHPLDAVVHMRSLEGTCRARMADRVHVMLRFDGLSARDVCDMSALYVQRFVSKNQTIVLAHDGQHVRAARRLQRAFHVVSYTGPYSLYVDMLLMVRASVFIGNPASTVSMNVAAVREWLGKSSNFDSALLWGVENRRVPNQFIDGGAT